MADVHVIGAAGMTHSVVEPPRQPVCGFAVSVFDGEATHHVRFTLGRWTCDCLSFDCIGICTHITRVWMSIQRDLWSAGGQEAA